MYAIILTKLKLLLKKMTLTAFLQAIGLTLICFFAPIGGLMAIILLLTFMDTCFGVYSAYKRGEKIESNKLFNFVVKTFFYQATIILGFLIDKFVFGVTFPYLAIPYLLAKAACIFWSWVELKSMDETNIKMGGKPFEKRIKEMLRFLKGLKTDIKGITEDKKDENK